MIYTEVHVISFEKNLGKVVQFLGVDKVLEMCI